MRGHPTTEIIVAGEIGNSRGPPYLGRRGVCTFSRREGSVALLIGGLVLFIGIHVVPSFAGLRAALAGRLGENGYKALFSLVSIAGLLLVAIGYGRVPLEQIFEPSQTARFLLPAAMAIAFLLLGVSVVPGRIRPALRHPMQASVLVWAAFHFLANGDLASNIMFGAFALWAVFAILSAEYRGKRLNKRPGSYKADLAGAVAGLLVYALVFHFHADLFGVSPI